MPRTFSFLRDLDAAQADHQRELVVAPGVVLDHIAITPEVCDDFLKFVAPTLARVARGRSFFARARRVSPAAGHPANGDASGRLTIHEMLAGPGPMAEQVAAMFHVPDADQLAHEEVIRFQLKNERMYHEGFALDVGPMNMATQGSVSLEDQSLDIKLAVRLPEFKAENAADPRRAYQRPDADAADPWHARPSADRSAGAAQSGLGLLAGVIESLSKNRAISARSDSARFARGQVAGPNRQPPPRSEWRRPAPMPPSTRTGRSRVPHSGRLPARAGPPAAAPPRRRRAASRGARPVRSECRPGVTAGGCSTTAQAPLASRRPSPAGRPQPAPRRTAAASDTRSQRTAIAVSGDEERCMVAACHAVTDRKGEPSARRPCRPILNHVRKNRSVIDAHYETSDQAGICGFAFSESLGHFQSVSIDDAFGHCVRQGGFTDGCDSRSAEENPFDGRRRKCFRVGIIEGVAQYRQNLELWQGFDLGQSTRWKRRSAQRPFPRPTVSWCSSMIRTSFLERRHHVRGRPPAGGIEAERIAGVGVLHRLHHEQC